MMILVIYKHRQQTRVDYEDLRFQSADLGPIWQSSLQFIGPDWELLFFIVLALYASCSVLNVASELQSAGHQQILQS
jgi:hypothetical protein